jgi:uncharacterized membrane protein AbrB (regulator of aidB expression)
MRARIIIVVIVGLVVGVIAATVHIHNAFLVGAIAGLCVLAVRLAVRGRQP